MSREHVSTLLADDCGPKADAIIIAEIVLGFDAALRRAEELRGMLMAQGMREA